MRGLTVALVAAAFAAAPVRAHHSFAVHFIVFEGVAARYMAFTPRPGEYVYPYDCDPSYGE